MRVSACITSLSGPALLAEERSFLSDAQPWGVILMGRSCQDRDQVRALIKDVHNALGREALIFIDQEGGRVARLKPPEWPKFPAAGVYGELYQQDPDAGMEACELGHQLMAGELYQLGIFADCAPDGDLRQPTTHDAIGDRAFGYSVEVAAALAGAALSGLKKGGVLGVIKHMPGQGRATVDSHHDLPAVDADLQQLELDFSVFSALSSQAAMGMTGHVAYDAIDGGVAATVSETVISRIIRKRIGFDGLLMTDDLGMDALGGDLKSRGERARAAGCDVLLHCSGFLTEPGAILSEMNSVAEAAGTLDGTSAARAENVMTALQAPMAIDTETGWARLTQLLSRLTARV